ncbi:MAG: preprotein translocase subunit YajC [Rickettsiaceae bacterium]|nr:MAG: preprotein translocase subunit YajC [Rickettsiaceae bacterium]
MLFATALADKNTIEIQETTELPQAPEQILSGWTSMIPMVLIFVVFYFFLIRPQENRRRQQASLVSGIKKGEEVLITSGLFGKVVSLDGADNSIEIEIAENVKVKCLKSAIVDIISRSENKAIDKINKKQR